jgi:hypothetical protein
MAVADKQPETPAIKVFSSLLEISILELQVLQLVAE